ncbi:DEAD/DEAH box helicase [Halodesulfurarchaeum formicicum]|uniref:ATP-dependent DNA helicase n=1 Tax=Halodesulfurarchaeum formicicum TaxID=1873524 RepID=A0A1J1ABG4_9EURY|nr:DEAD/DEAH box helicase [Halodesulfurarchaeum formicicum]APE95221.1 ATP-dependent DNA helicase [Halodesulfurarchaeum formicicum]
MSETGRADAFAALGPAVRAALSERGFSTPTEPQRRAIPPIAAGQHTLVIAPTGTGKTETAMLPIFDALVADDRDGFGALYITPLRALNRDMRDRLEWWGETLDLDVQVRHGDTTQYQRQKQAEDPPDVLVTTPETVQAMLTGSTLREGLEDVGYVVIDEVHELAASKRGAQLTVAMERLRELAGPIQRVGLSATVGDPGEVGKFLTGDRGCEIVSVDVTSKIDVEVVQPEITPADRDRSSELMTTPTVASHLRYITDLVETHDSTLIFVNTRQTAEALGSRFKEMGANIGVHHGSLSKSARIEVEDSFKAGELDALLCTSSMELGIDVGRIDHVVQYASPREVARLLQRVGRAGHRHDTVSSGTVVTGHPDDTLEALAIARRATDGQVEPAEIHHGSLDVVANQVVGLAMDAGEISARGAYEIVTNAYPFRDLEEETFREVVRELNSNYIIWLDEAADRIEKSGGTWQYYYRNLSMIPDEETYEVFDIASGAQVGTLDERFVVNFAEPGATFIQRGDMWRISEIDEDKERVEVSPIEDPAGEVPSWTGQEIPVPYPVAQEVGELRGVTADQLEAGAPSEAVAADLASRYPAGTDTIEDALGQIERHVESGAPLPTDDRILIESHGRTIVVNVAGGLKGNETIGRLLAALLGQQTGSSVGIDVDPYRIELEVPRGIRANDVREVLQTTDPEHVGPLLELSLNGSETLKFTLSQVAAKFGALKRWKGGDGVSLNRVMAALEDTPVYDEAVREVFHEILDIDRAQEIIAAIQSEAVELAAIGERTAIGTGGRQSGSELLTPENADASVIETVRERIQEDEVRLVCLHCLEYDRETTVKRVRDQPQCPHCESTQIAALSPYADDVVSALKAQDKDEEQERLTERAYRNASLVQGHGKQAVIALSARGVGPENAARIINRHRESESDFYRDILEREREYARTKAFW